MVPKMRGKVVPRRERAASDIWAVFRNPKKACSSSAATSPAISCIRRCSASACSRSHQRLDFTELIFVQVGAGMLGNVAPVPGGIGVQEAALTAGLTAFGIPATPALATVLVFRGITFALPPFFGFFTLHWLKARATRRRQTEGHALTSQLSVRTSVQ